MLNIKSKNYIKTMICFIILFVGFIAPTYAVTKGFNKANGNLIVGSSISKDARYLFVLHSEKGYMTSSELILKDFYQHLVYFSDMPNRIAGSYDSTAFLKDWNNIFSSDNPNVVLSFYDKKDKQYKDITLEISNPEIDGDDVTFKIEKILDMKNISKTKNEVLSIKFKNSSLFIDSIGCWVPACWL